MRILLKRRAGNLGRTYEGPRVETTEGVRVAVNVQGYCWVTLSHHEDEAIDGAARNIYYIYADGSIDFHILYCLQAEPVIIHLILRSLTRVRPLP